MAKALVRNGASQKLRFEASCAVETGQETARGREARASWRRRRWEWDTVEAERDQRQNNDSHGRVRRWKGGRKRNRAMPEVARGFSLAGNAGRAKFVFQTVSLLGGIAKTKTRSRIGGGVKM